MSLAELLPIVGSLPHQEKLSLLQFLANALAQEEGLPELKSGDEFPIWSPYGAFAAAEALQQTLQLARGQVPKSNATASTRDWSWRKHRWDVRMSGCFSEHDIRTESQRCLDSLPSPIAPS